MDLQANQFQRMSVEEFDTTKLLAHASRQARERGYEKFPIVDVDSHHYENESMAEILDYLDDPVLRQLALAGSKPNAKNARILNTLVGYQDMGGRITRYALRNYEKTPGKNQRDTALTKRWMDAVGVDIAVLFPTPMLALGVHPQVEVEIALSRAYNRWLCERVLAHEPRLVSMLYLPFNDPDATYAFVKEFGEKKGVVGFLITSTRYRPVHANQYMKTYALLEEMGKPIAFHGSYHWHDKARACSTASSRCTRSVSSGTTCATSPTGSSTGCPSASPSSR